VFITWRPFALEEIEQSSHALLLNTNGGYCRSFFHGSLLSSVAAFKGPERLQEISDMSRAAAARRTAKS
jgi:hypothetical protein